MRFVLRMFYHFLDCPGCYQLILKAVTDCFDHEASWLHCFQDMIGATNPCIECECAVVREFAGIFAINWSC